MMLVENDMFILFRHVFNASLFTEAYTKSLLLTLLYRLVQCPYFRQQLMLIRLIKFVLQNNLINRILNRELI